LIEPVRPSDEELAWAAQEKRSAFLPLYDPELARAGMASAAGALTASDTEDQKATMY